MSFFAVTTPTFAVPLADTVSASVKLSAPFVSTSSSLALSDVPTESHNQFLLRTSGEYPIGIDISHWQANLMPHFEDPGFAFVISKATEGNTWKDASFKKNWTYTKKLKMVRGAYHFYLPNDTPIQQADNYLSTLSYWRLFWLKDKPSANLPPIVDVETAPKGKSKEQFQSELLTFLAYVEAKTNRKPIIYTYIWFADTYLDNPKLAEYPLWIAHYTPNDSPTLPKTWQSKVPKFWQRSHNYKLGSYNTDFNVFFGSISELKRGLVAEKAQLQDRNNASSGKIK